MDLALHAQIQPPSGALACGGLAQRGRHYAKPGYLDEIGHPYLKAFDCENASGPTLGLAPPCAEQGPFMVPSFTGDYPQVHRLP
jgi:hypothetical protein